jgi:multiple sugar transport system substrate-binding protein
LFAGRLTRRSMLRVLGGGSSLGVLAAIGCSPAPAPTGTPAPKPAATKPAAAATSPPAGASAPAATTAPAATPAAAGAAAPTGPVTLRHQTKNGGEEQKLTQEFIDKFQQANPGVTIKMEPPAPGFTHIQRYLADLAAGTPPDTYLTDDYYIATLGSRNAVASLDDYVKADKTQDYDDYYKTVAENTKYQGKQYGIPYFFYTYVLLYNKDMFAEAGVPLPPADYKDTSWTYDKALEAALKLTKRDGDKVTQFGYLWDDSVLSRYSSMLYSYGASVMDSTSNPTKCVLDADDAIAALQWHADLRNKHKAAPFPADISALNAAANNPVLLLNKKLAMGVSGSWGIASMQTDAKFNWGVSPLPRAPKGGKPGDAIATNAYVISQAGKNRDLAYRLLTFVSSKDFERARATRKGLEGVPGRSSVVPDWLKLPPPPDPKERQVVTDVGNYGTPIIVHPSYLEIQDAIVKGSEEMWLGKRPAAQVVKDIVPKVNELLAKTPS